ncbi:MAG: MoaD/ThiS family protein [Desulfovibrio sp.]|jgi:molybdopterin converting factor small subunit|nr:MoaD/ThiS family protein [Desulfovibrio sp.]MBI4961111.1 MoaD/ThiS family protein [Desulfovibrio sp.]
MNITVKCFATLNSFQPENEEHFPLHAGETVEALIERLGMAPDMVAVLFVNGVHAARDRVLSDGDRVSLFPAVGGG